MFGRPVGAHAIPKRRRSGRWKALTVAVVAELLASLVVLATDPAPSRPPAGRIPVPAAAPARVGAAQGATANDLVVSWIPGSGGGAVTATEVALRTISSSGRVTRERRITCFNGCTSATFRGLGVGHRYVALVEPLSGAGGPAAPTPSSPVRLVSNCQSVGCVGVDATKAIEPAAHQASGILDSLYPVGADATALSALKITMWRGTPDVASNGSYNWSSWDVATAAGVPTTLMLQQLWAATHSGTGWPATPWSNWGAYRSWVRATVRTILASGHHPSYWEVYNEAGQAGYYSPADFVTDTPNRLLKQFLVAYQAIRSVDPRAQIIGPSSEHFSDAPGEYGNPDLDLVTFLRFAAAHHLVLAAVSWHEIDDTPSPAANSVAPAIIEDHVAEARRIIASLPALGSPKIFLNEYGVPELEPIPGWDVAYLQALTDSRVNGAVRSCWSGDCANPALDGFLGFDATTPQSPYWVQAAYAKMSGAMVATTTNLDQLSAVASSAGPAAPVRVLLGRGVGCAQDAWCAAVWRKAVAAPPIPVRVTLRLPWSSGTVSLSMAHIVGSDLVAGGPPPNLLLPPQRIVRAGAGSGTVTTTIPAFADGDAYSVVATHSAVRSP